MGSNWARVFVALPIVWIGAFGDRRQGVNASDRDPITPAEGLTFRLSEGEPSDEPTPAARPRPAPALPLSDGEAQALFNQLPPLKTDDDRPGFALRDKSLTPPRAGRTLLSPFPGTGERQRPSTGEPGPLRVLRRAPEGEVDVAPRLSVTFSQPMVAVASNEIVTGKAVPVQLVPEPEGQWRWLGTQTLVFEPTTRFPKATDYRVRVLAGTRSATGGSLTAHATWTFRTPPPKVLHTYPCCDGNRGDVPFVLVFDQLIDPQAVLAKLRVKAGDSAAIQALRLATLEEVRTDPEALKTWKKAPEGQAMAFRTAARLPLDTLVEVVLESGAPSAEGPKRTQDPKGWTFRTFGPLRIAKHHCGSGSGTEQCPPEAPWLIEFNNSLDEERFHEDSVRVEPSVPGLRQWVSGKTLTLSGHVRGRTTYSVNLPAELADVHHQNLGQDRTVSISVGEGRPRLLASGQGLVVLDPAAAKPRFSVYSTEVTALKVAAYAVEARDWNAFQHLIAMEAARAPEGAKPPGRLLLSREIRVDAPPQEITETNIDLAPFLPGGRGHVLLVVEDASVPPNGVAMPPAPHVVRWIQSSRIGLAAFVDHGKLVAWASSLADGRPLPGVNVNYSRAIPVPGPMPAALQCCRSARTRLRR